MNKFTLLLLVFSFVFSSFSCGGNNNNNDDKDIADDPDNVNDIDTGNDDVYDEGDSGEDDDVMVPPPRIAIKLSWDKGFKSYSEFTSNKEGTVVDLDLHLIKKTSLEAPIYGYEPLEGVLGTLALEIFENEEPDHDPANPDDKKYFRHDDCSWGDDGNQEPYVFPSIYFETIEWAASLNFDNTWGGNDFKSPEIIWMGSHYDRNYDGIPDAQQIIDDQYLVVVSYSNCVSQYSDKIDRCDSEYVGEDSANEVNARVNIIVDGEEVPRGSGDNIYSDRYSATTKDFKIKWGEWKVIAVIKWDSTLPGSEKNPKAYQGNAVVTDVAIPYLGIETDASAYKRCSFSFTDAYLVPIWNKTAYYSFVNEKRDPNDENSPTIGECY